MIDDLVGGYVDQYLSINIYQAVQAYIVSYMRSQYLLFTFRCTLFYLFNLEYYDYCYYYYFKN